MIWNEIKSGFSCRTFKAYFVPKHSPVLDDLRSKFLRSKEKFVFTHEYNLCHIGTVYRT